MEEQTRKMAEAHRRMSGVALGLVAMFGPVNAVGVLVGYMYKKLRARNEVLDLRVYNMAALAILNVDLDQLAEEMQGEPGKPMDESATRPRGWLRRGPWLKR